MIDFSKYKKTPEAPLETRYTAILLADVKLYKRITKHFPSSKEKYQELVREFNCSLKATGKTHENEYPIEYKRHFYNWVRWRMANPDIIIPAKNFINSHQKYVSSNDVISFGNLKGLDKSDIVP